MYQIYKNFKTSRYYSKSAFKDLNSLNIVAIRKHFMLN